MKFKNSTFAGLLILLIFLNYIDANATAYWFTEGIAYETNPIMQKLLNLSTTTFIYVKLIFVGCASVCLWFARKRKLTHILIIPIILIYIYVFILHCNIAYHSFYN